MQPAGLTVALATILLVAALDVDAVRAAAANLHPTHLTLDQYSPLPPHHRHGVYERAGGEANWKDQDPDDQPFSIASRGPIHEDGPRRRPFEVDFFGKDFILPREDALSKDDFPPLGRRQLDSPAAVEGTDYRGAKVMGSFSREIIPASEMDDSFVADDTFQDQGPGSVEIYKLDLFKEKTLMNPTPTVKVPIKSKSKIPKKTARVNWKTKTTEYKSTSPKIVQKQSNFFEELRTDAPSSNGEAFGVGGVPELQVGCEGLEASSHKLKRSADTVSGKEKALGTTVDPWLHVTPVSINLDYDDLSGEEGYEEMDELLKLKKLETTTKRSKQNRGDMDASFLGDNFFRPPYPEKLPVRGDLGKVSTTKDKNSFASPTSTLDNDGKKWTGSQEYDSGIESAPTNEDDKEGKSKGHKKLYEYSLGSGGGRKLLWAENSEDVESAGETHFLSKRSILWGFGEDEGAVTSDELREEKRAGRREENERRRQEYEERRLRVARRRKQQEYANSTSNAEVDRIREEYERMLEEREREIRERRRRPEETGSLNRWQDEERRREEMRRREEENRRRAMQYPGHERNDDAARKAQEEEMRRERERWIENERRKQELEDLRRRVQQSTQDPDQDQRQRAHEEEMRRREEMSRQLEERKRQEAEEMRRRQSDDEERRRRLHEDEIRRQEDIRRRQEIEDARRRQEETRVQDPRMRNQTEERRRLHDEEMRRREHNRRLDELRRRQEEEEKRRRLYENPVRNLSESDRRDLEERQREWMLKRQQAEEEERRRQEINRYSPPENLVRPDSRPDSRPDRNGSRYDRREEERRLREQQEIERERKLRDYINRNRPINVDRMQNRWQEEEEERRRQAEDRVRVEEVRRREEYERRRQEEERRRLEEERRRYHPDTHYPGRNQTNATRDHNEEYQRRLEEHRRRLEEERKLQDYIRRNQPTSVPNQNASARNWYEERRTIDAARQYDRMRPENSGRRHHGPSAPINVDPRVRSYEEARRQQEAQRLQEETRRTIEQERQAAEERRKEAARREEETRRLQSRRYEEERKRQEAARMEDERRRKEMIEEQNRRTHAGRQRPRYNDRYPQERRVPQQIRRQNTNLVPSNLVLDENRRAIERNRQREELERRRMEAERAARNNERRRQEEDRLRDSRHREENTRGMREHRRRQEESRLNSLPVSARIIVRPGASSSSNTPLTLSRAGFGDDIVFKGLNPTRGGVEASRFPAAPTRRPSVQSPGPCVWAVVQCCPSNRGRLVTCFESMGCPGVNWDPNPCRGSIADAARAEIMKFYEAAENEDRY